MAEEQLDDFSDFGELLPEITTLNTPFWDGLAQGEVRLQHCQQCGANQYPAESFCYQCGGGALQWQPVAGGGTIYSFIVVHQSYHPAFKPHLPYTVAIVQLDEGPRMLAAMLHLNSPVAIGDRVQPRIQMINNKRSILLYEPAA